MDAPDDGTLWREIEAKLNGRIRPVLQAHGGDLTLLTVANGVVGVRFEGACVGCPLRPVTMAVTIGPALRAIAGVEGVQAEGVRVSQASASRLAAALRGAPPGPGL
jgi:Fe-S cluster biogenesis protein NfuA